MRHGNDDAIPKIYIECTKRAMFVHNNNRPFFLCSLRRKQFHKVVHHRRIYNNKKNTKMMKTKNYFFNRIWIVNIQSNIVIEQMTGIKWNYIHFFKKNETYGFYNFMSEAILEIMKMLLFELVTDNKTHIANSSFYVSPLYVFFRM